MSERKALNPSDVLRFLEFKGALGGCSACGKKDFECIDERGTNARAAFMAFKFPGHELAGATTIDIALLACRHCGAIRAHARQPIAEWVAKNPTH